MKKIIFILLLLIILFVPIQNFNVYAIETSTSEDFDNVLNEQISDFDFSELDKILKNFSSSESGLFGSSSFLDKLKSVLSGDFKDGYNDVLSAFLSVLLEDILSFVPLLCTIVAIVILGSFISGLKSSFGSKSVSDVVYFVCFGVVIVLVSNCVIQVIGLTTEVLSSMKTQMEVIFPILLTLMTALCGTVSVSVFQPAIVLLSNGIVQVFNNIIVPLFSLTFVFTVVQNISSTIKLDKFTSFFSSAFKWIIGIVFTVFFAFLSIQGIVASTFDGISIRMAKYTVKSYVPIMGGYLSDGFDLILGSSMLIKNAVGATGLFLMIITIFAPIIKIAVLIFGFKLISAILEPIADSRISSFLFSVSKALTMLVACILGVAFMYFLTVGLVMVTCNVL